MTDTPEFHPPASDLVALFRAHGGRLRVSEALALGANRYQFYRLRDEGIIEPVSRGFYRLSELPSLGHPDLVAVATRFPRAVLCLVSALHWHDITTQIPRQIDLAVARNARFPLLVYPPVRGHRFSPERFRVGVEAHEVDGVPLKVYNPEKTLADCFAHRNVLGMDVVLEALRIYRKRRQPQYARIMAYARICRVDRVMRPYLEAVL